MASYQAPPACNETRTQPSQLKDDIKRYQIKRKPTSPQTYEALQDVDSTETAPVLPPRPGLSTLDTSIPAAYDQSSRYSAPSRTNTNSTIASSSTACGYETPRTDSFPLPLSAISTASIDSTSSKTSASSHMKKTYEEARHFAGGLISRPRESTKHFTILRHSHGLVFYQGSSTSLAVSIFSDAPLPPDRTLWLQSKGWTGKTGMKAKALVGRNGNWLDVTPTLAVGSEQLNPNDERAWQRDFQKFRKKAPSKIRDRHQLRETAVVRIPVGVGDGYFQLVLCTPDKKKIFCTSPSFRVLSTSLSPSSVRGASLSTLPLEFGAMVLATYGKGAVGKAASVVTAPFQSQVQQYMPSFWTQKAASAAYEASGTQKRIDRTAGDVERRYEMTLEESLATAEAEELALEDGPKAPYPINFVARAESVTNHSDAIDLPIFTLSVPENVSLKLHGYYFGWARPSALPQNGKAKPSSPEIPWIQALISATLTDIKHIARVNFQQANQKKFALHIISESDDEMVGILEQFEIRIMGFMRPDEPVQRMHLEEGLQAGEEAAVEASMLAEVNDVSMVQDVLDHPSWAAESAEREAALKGKTSRVEKLKKGYADTRIAAQNQISRVPLSKIGMRAPGDAMRDRAMVVNGFYVIR